MSQSPEIALMRQVLNLSVGSLVVIQNQSRRRPKMWIITALVIIWRFVNALGVDTTATQQNTKRPHGVHAWPCKWTPQHQGGHTVYTHGRESGRPRTPRRPHCVHAWPCKWTPQNTKEATPCTRMAVKVDAPEHQGGHTVYTHGRASGRPRTPRRPHCVHAWPCKWTPQNTKEATLCTRMAVQVDASEHQGGHTVYTHGRESGRPRTPRRPHCVHAWPCKWTPHNTKEATPCTRMAVKVDAPEHQEATLCTRMAVKVDTSQHQEATLCTHMAVQVDASEHQGGHTVYTHGRVSGRLRTPRGHTVYTHGRVSGRLRTPRRPHCVHP